MEGDHLLALSDSLQQLRNDLASVERQGEGSDLKLRLEKVEIEFTTVAGRSVSGSAGIKWYILSAEAKGDISSNFTQKVSVTLSIVDSRGSRKDISGIDQI